MLTALEIGDLPEILGIEERAYSRPWSERMFLGEFANALGLHLGYRRDGVLVGYVFGWLLFDDLHINNIAVHPDHQGCGIGSALLREIMSAAAARGARKALLEVRPSNANARRLYERFGFEEVARRSGYYEDTAEDALVLFLRMDHSE